MFIQFRFLTVEEKKKIGHLCKLLIDQGRIKYLQQKGFSPALQYYIEPQVSLENVLLTALPNHFLYHQKQVLNKKNFEQHLSSTKNNFFNCIFLYSWKYLNSR